MFSIIYNSYRDLKCLLQYDFVKEEETFYMNLGDFKSHLQKPANTPK